VIYQVKKKSQVLVLLWGGGGSNFITKTTAGVWVL
jgi:hypothetical protein